MLIIFTTVDSREKAGELAKALLEERLAACISYWEVSSKYWWNSAIEEAQEYVLKIKTVEEVKERLVERLRALHPYEVPEIVIVKAEAEGEYGKWLRNEVRME